MTMHYLDANASEPLRPEARRAMLAAMDISGNPSSVHAAGRAARRIMEDAREALAVRFGGQPADLVFTSGGTEADALAVHALGQGRRVLIGATEHDAIRAAAANAEIVPVGADGLIDLSVLATMLETGPPALVCLMLANNEVGTIQPVAEAAALCRSHGALLHVDAVQGAGRLVVVMAGEGSPPTTGSGKVVGGGPSPAMTMLNTGAHSIALSSHKLGGPTGVGALLLAPEVTGIAPLIRGGGQERGRRGGTPPLTAIAGFAAAALACGDSAPLAALRDAAERAAVACGARVIGADAPRLPNTTCLALPGARADTQVIALDLDGIAVSAGAACSSGKVAASHVLQAMGLGALAGQAIRVSLPWNATQADVDAFAASYARMADRLRSPLVSRAA